MFITSLCKYYKLEKMWFGQDSATPHSANKTSELLKQKLNGNYKMR